MIILEKDNIEEDVHDSDSLSEEPPSDDEIE